jgi:hypothetical protein
MHDKQTIRVVLVLHCQESRVIGSPKRLLPGFFEVICLCDIGADTRDHLAERRRHGVADRPHVLASSHNVGFMTWDTGKCRRTFGTADRERKGIQNGGVHRRVARRLYGFRRSTGETLVHMQGHAPMPGGGEQGVGEFLPLLRLEE